MSDGFLWTIVLGPVFLIAAVFVFPMIDEGLLRIGLWMNGVTGQRADEIVEFKKTGKLPR